MKKVTLILALLISASTFAQPVAYYPFNGSANDESGNGRNGVVYGAVLIPDRFGNENSAYFFDAYDHDFIKASGVGLPTASRTVSVWFNNWNFRVQQQSSYLGYGGSGTMGTSWLMGATTTQYGTLALFTGDYNHPYSTAGMTVPYSSLLGYRQWEGWHNWVITTDTTGTRMYLDGTLVGHNTNLYVDNTHTANGDLILGQFVNPNGDGPFEAYGVYGWMYGGLDDIRIYDYSLSSEEVHALYHENGWKSPVAVELISPENDYYCNTDEIKLEWNYPANIERFMLEVSIDSLFETKIVDSTLTGTETVFRGLTLNQWYWWRVSGDFMNEGWGPVSETRRFMYHPYPTVVALTAPEDGTQQMDDSVRLEWTPTIPNVDKYWVEYSTNSLFIPATTDSSVTDTSYILRNLSPDTYWWRVRAHNIRGWGNFSPLRTFEILPKPDLPTVVILDYPVDGSTLSSSSVELVWFPSSPVVDRYLVDIAADSLFLFKKSDSSVTDTKYMVTNLTNATYWWRVKAHNLSGWGEFSAPHSFTVLLTDVVEGNVPTEFKLMQNYPNPFNPSTVIQYAIPTTAHVTLRVYDNAGQEIETLVSETQPASVYAVRWNGTGRSSGAYFYRIVVSGDSTYTNTKRMTLLK